MTHREQEVLDLLAEGLTSSEMAGRLTLAVSSVRWYVQQIYGKLGVNGKRQAITRASQLGLLQPGAVIPAPNLPAPRLEQVLPTGTVTFLFTDIQGSTPLWESHPQPMAAAIQVHNAAVRKAIESNGGVVFKIVGDSFQAAFATTPQALQAAIDSQRTLQAAAWNELGPLKVRMGLHTGRAELDPGGDEYAVSHAKNRVARIMSAAQGGQVLLSQETADLVRRELPAEVSLQDLGEHILKGMQQPEHLYQVMAPDLPQTFPALLSNTTHTHNLPLQLTPFIGRETEIKAVCELLNDHRLVTLTGSGGVGKTRLTIQVAGQTLAEVPDGVWYIELAPITDPELVPQIVAATLGLREEPNQPLIETLSHFLINRELLIVLDNCEHLLEACAHLADTLLRKAPRLKILASSREALGITGEYAFRVPSLAIPDPAQMPDLAELQEYGAVRLFAERARAVLPTFTLNEHNALAIARICQRLDGIPLALELAAARLNLLTPEQLASRLDHAFRLLTGGSRTALPRQQTLRATIDWSYALLSAPEQVLLRRLAVFAGGSPLEAIEAICVGEDLAAEQILDLLGGLVNKSMVSAERKQQEETRYRLLETVRQYAREKLYDAKESQVFYDRHLTYYLELAEAIEPQLRTSVALERLHVLESEMDNLRSALFWALDEISSLKTGAGLRLASALLNLWHTQNFHTEGYAWLNKGLFSGAGVPVDTRTRARAAFAASHLILPLGRTAEARRWADESLAIYSKIEDTYGMVMAQSLLGEICAWDESFDEAKELGAASLATCRTLNDAWLLAWVLCRFGTSLFFHDESTLARPLIEESLEIFEQLGDPLQVGSHFIMLGWVSFAQGDFAEARVYYAKALTSAQAMQSKWTEANAWLNLGRVAYMQGDYQKMCSDLQESVALHRETGNPYLGDSLHTLGTAEINLGHPRQAALHFKECLQITSVSEYVIGSLLGIARVAMQTNQVQTASDLLGATKRMVDEKNVQLDLIQQEEYKRVWAEVKAQLDQSELKQTISEGEALSLEDAVAMALTVEI